MWLVDSYLTCRVVTHGTFARCLYPLGYSRWCRYCLDSHCAWWALRAKGLCGGTHAPPQPHTFATAPPLLIIPLLFSWCIAYWVHSTHLLQPRTSAYAYGVVLVLNIALRIVFCCWIEFLLNHVKGLRVEKEYEKEDEKTEEQYRFRLESSRCEYIIIFQYYRSECMARN